MNRIRLRELREAKGLFPATIDDYLGVMRGSGIVFPYQISTRSSGAMYIGVPSVTEGYVR